MKNKSLYSLLIAGTLMLCGCEVKTHKENDDADWKKNEAMLINVEKDIKLSSLSSYCSAFFYFDTDGNPETAELLLSVATQSKDAPLNIFNNAKIGSYKTIKEWENLLAEKHAYRKWTKTSYQGSIFSKKQNTRE